MTEEIATNGLFICLLYHIWQYHCPDNSPWHPLFVVFTTAATAGSSWNICVQAAALSGLWEKDMEVAPAGEMTPLLSIAVPIEEAERSVDPVLADSVLAPRA